MKRLLALLAALLFSLPAMAGSSLISVTPGSGASIATTTNSNNQMLENTTIWDYSAGANGLGVNADHSITATQGAAAASGPWLFTPWIAGAVNGATNGTYTNILQGNAALSAAAPLPVGPSYSGDIIVTPSSSFTGTATGLRTANTVVANSATAGSVVFLSWTVARANAGNGYVRRAIFTSTGKSITAPANFVLYLFTGTVAPTTTAGDNAAFSGAVVLANEFCAIPITLTEKGSDVSVGRGQPDVGNECNFVAGAGVTTIWGLLVTTGAYTAASGEVEKFILEVHQN